MGKFYEKNLKYQGKCSWPLVLLFQDFFNDRTVWNDVIRGSLRTGFWKWENVGKFKGKFYRNLKTIFFC